MHHFESALANTTTLSAGAVITASILLGKERQMEERLTVLMDLAQAFGNEMEIVIDQVRNAASHLAALEASGLVSDDMDYSFELVVHDESHPQYHAHHDAFIRLIADALRFGREDCNNAKDWDVFSRINGRNVREELYAEAA